MCQQVSGSAFNVIGVSFLPTRRFLTLSTSSCLLHCTVSLMSSPLMVGTMSASSGSLLPVSIGRQRKGVLHLLKLWTEASRDVKKESIGEETSLVAAAAMVHSEAATNSKNPHFGAFVECRQHWVSLAICCKHVETKARLSN